MCVHDKMVPFMQRNLQLFIEETNAVGPKLRTIVVTGHSLGSRLTDSSFKNRPI